MANNPELKVRISAELNQIRQSLSVLQNDLAQVGAKGQKAGNDANAGLNKMAGSINGAVTAIKGLVAAYATLATGKQFVQLADQAKLLEARLKLVTNSADELVRAQEALFQLAQRSRAPIKETVELYARFAQSTKELGVNQDTLLSVVESVNQAVQLSGASTESANAALIQLGQGLASGTLRGEELNSVLEQTPRLAQAIAKGMGVSVGELRKLGQEGKITADQVINSLLDQKDVLQSEFAQLPVTAGQAFTQLGNSVAVAVGEIDKVVGASGGLASLLQDIAAFLDSGQLQEAFIGTFATWSSAIGSIIKDIDNLIGVIDDLFGGLNDEGEASVNFITGAFRNMPANIKAFLQLIVVEAAYIFDRTLIEAQKFRDKAKAIFTDDTFDQVEQRYQQEVAAVQQAREDTIAAIMQERDLHVDTGNAAVERYRKEREAAKATFEKPIGGGVKPIAPIIDTSAADKEREKALKKEEQERQQLLESNAKNFEQAQIRLAEIEGRHLDARLQEIDAKYKTQLDDMIKAGDVKGQELIKKLIDEEKAQAQFDELKRKFDQNLADLAAKEESLANRVKIGDISQVEADRQLGEARDQAQTVGAGILQDLQGAAGSDPEKQAQVEAMTEKLNAQKAAATGLVQAQNELGQSLQNLVQGFAAFAANAAIDGLSQAMFDIVKGTKSAGDAIRDFVRGMADAMLQMVTRIMATMIVLQGISAITGVPVAALAQFAGMTGQVKHSGGIVGQGGTIRSGLNPLMFAAAPRYHSGGVAGLKPGEVPAVLQKGEEVLTRDDPRHQANGGGQQGGGSTRVINVVDPNMVADYMSSAAGEKVLVNVIQRNAGSIKQVIS